MEKLLPQNIEAECGVLGSIIIDPEAITQVADFLQPEDFYRDAHRTIYEVILQLYDQREAADFITICDRLEGHNRLEDVGGAAYITSLINMVPTSGNVEYYGRIVERTAILRRLIHAAGQIATIAYEEADAEIALDKAEQIIFNISQRHAHSDFSSVRELLSDYMIKLDQLHERRGAIVGTPTGFTDLDRLTGGLQKSDLLILAARPAVGKCLSAKMLIDDPATGERLTIEECVKCRLPLVLGISEQGQVRFAAVSNWIDSGIKPCYRIRTQSGREVEVTMHHPFLTVHGWIPLHDLRVGDTIAVPSVVPVFGHDESWPLENVRLLARIIAEGELTPTSPVFTNTDPIIVEDFKQIIASQLPVYAIKQYSPDYTIAQPKNAETQHNGTVLPKNLATMPLSDPGLMSKRAEEKFFPAYVWKWSKRYLAEFLRTLMSCDGSMYLHSHGAPVIELSVASCKLATDVQHAWLRFGITARLYQKNQRYWHVVITNPTSVKRYQREIGWVGEKAARYAEILDNDVLRLAASSDIYWDQIIAIDNIGEQQVYDLTVPDGANFVAQDIFVHNTSFALSMAHNTAVKHQRSVAVFSLEMSKEQLVQRLLSMDAGIDQQRLRTGWIEDDEWDRIVIGMDTLSQASIWIDDTASISTMEMRSKARRLQAEHGIDLIIVDYLQLMQSTAGGKRNENRVQEISEISRNLKGLARELNVPVLALAQLSRAVESRQSKVPQLSDLRESGCISGDSLVYLPDQNTYQPIEQLIGQRDFNVLALNMQTWKLEAAKVSNAFATGRKPIYKLTTLIGRTIRATANHKFLTIHGWRRLDELKQDERLALPRHLPDGTTISTKIIPSAEYTRHLSRERAAKMTNLIKSQQLALAAESDIYWDRIVSIEPDGEEEVYDLTIDSHHNFIANQLIVHNSIEQDADVVMFIYREDVYNPETERKNIADIIVAKHRNGPVGEVSLYFQASQTRFRDLEVSPPAEE